jgi:formylglycine-generating enzyme required for sulfatase activity
VILFQGIFYNRDPLHFFSKYNMMLQRFYMNKTGKLRIAVCAAAVVLVAVAIGLLVRGCTKPAAPDEEDAHIVIAAVAIAITGPATGEAPVTTAPAGGINYTCGAVSWFPKDNIFRGGTVYTASVTLTANENYTFSDELAAKINNRYAQITDDNGETVTISLKFDATLAKMVTSITVITQPVKLDYAHGDRLDLGGLVITLVYEDDETEDVTPDGFASRNIMTNPVNGARLSISAHNDRPVTVSCGRERTDTNNLRVDKAAPAITWPTGLTAVYEQTLSDISLASFNNSDAGAFRWTTPGDSAGALGTQSHKMTFTPADTANYNTITAHVNVRVLLGVRITSIPAGTFMMGSPGTEAGRYGDEVQCRVTLSGFNMERYEVTQGQYEAVMGINPSSFKANAGAGENQKRRPVEGVSWYDTLVFCNKLSMKEGLTPAYSIGGKTDPDEWGPIPTGLDAVWDGVEIVTGSNGYRLPTAAQWEYACRAGTTTPWHSGENSDNLGEYAWISNNSDSKTHEVGLKQPNAWGLYDMHGNVFEWCWDWYGAAYPTETQINPMGASSGSYRVIHGGGWNGSAQVVRSAYRGYPSPYSRGNFLGFRVLRP